MPNIILHFQAFHKSFSLVYKCFSMVCVTVQIYIPERLHIYYFEIPRKRPNEQERVRLEQPSFVERFIFQH